MRALNAVDIASMAVSSSNSTIILLQLENGGSSSRWSAQFPSLDEDTFRMLHGPVFLEYDSWIEAADAFATLTADCAAGDTGGIITGSITFVGTPFNEDDGIEAREWGLQDESRPVFNRSGCRWSYEPIAERI